MIHDPATIAVCRAMDAADEHIHWEPHMSVVLVLPSEAELHEQERARKRQWQANRFDQLRKMLR